MRIESKAGHEPQNQAPALRSGAAGAPPPSGDVSCYLSQAGAQPDPVTLTEDLWAKIAQDLPPPSQAALAQTSQALKAATEKPLWSSFRNRFYPGQCFNQYIPPQLAGREALGASNRRWQNNDLSSQTRLRTLLPDPAASLEGHEMGFKRGADDVGLVFVVRQGVPESLLVCRDEDKLVVKGYSPAQRKFVNTYPDAKDIAQVVAHPAGHQVLLCAFDGTVSLFAAPGLGGPAVPQELIYQWQPLGRVAAEDAGSILSWRLIFHPARSNWVVVQDRIKGNTSVWDTEAQKELCALLPNRGLAGQYPAYFDCPPRLFIHPAREQITFQWDYRSSYLHTGLLKSDGGIAWQRQRFPQLPRLLDGQFLHGAEHILLAQVRGDPSRHIWIDTQSGTASNILFPTGLADKINGWSTEFVALAAAGESLHFNGQTLCHMVITPGPNTSPKELGTWPISRDRRPWAIGTVLPQPAAANLVIIMGTPMQPGEGGRFFVPQHTPWLWLVKLDSNPPDEPRLLAEGPSQGHRRALWHPLHQNIFFTFGKKSLCAWHVSQSNILSPKVLWETSQEGETLQAVDIHPREPDSVVCTTQTKISAPEDPLHDAFSVRVEKISI